MLLIADGSEVSTLADAAQLLAEEGISARIISVPSEGLFRDQGTAYVREILTPGVPRYGLTSGLSVNLRTLVGDDGFIHGLNHFGYSAPYKVLDEKFGYNGPSVAIEVKEFLKSLQ